MKLLPILLALTLLSSPAWACECYIGSRDSGGIRIVCDGPDDDHRRDEDGIIQPYGTAFYKRDRQFPLTKPSCLVGEMGWDGRCHKGDLDEYAYSDACKGKPSIKQDPTWKKIENLYGKDDDQISWVKPGCYSLREPKASTSTS